MLVTKRNKILNDKGIGLVEVIAALGISVLVLTSLVSLSLFTLRSSLTSKLQLEGTKFANRELELVRAYRDSSTEWHNDSGTGFFNNIQNCYSATQDPANSCHMVFSGGLDVASGIGEEGSGAETLRRYFFASRIDGTQLQDTPAVDQVVRINVVVTWDIGTETKFSRLYTDLTNWENK